MDTAIHEREVLIKAFSDVTKEFEGREWIMEGRGCYAFDDDEYRKEVQYLYEAFENIKTEMWSNIKSKTYEYKNKIEQPFLKQNEEVLYVLETLKRETMLSDEGILMVDELLKSFNL